MIFTVTIINIHTLSTDFIFVNVQIMCVKEVQSELQGYWQCSSAWQSDEHLDFLKFIFILDK